MRQVMVRYRVKPGRAAENEELVRAVYEELHRTQPPGFRYATYQLDDGASFVHLATESVDNAASPLAGLAAFQRFVKDIAERCDDPPTVTQLRDHQRWHPGRPCRHHDDIVGRVLRPAGAPVEALHHHVVDAQGPQRRRRALPQARERALHPHERR